MATNSKSNSKSFDISNATMPNSVEAEQQLLCSIMRNNSMQLEIVSNLVKDDFYQEGHKHIFEAMKDISLANKTIDYATVIDALRRNGKLAQVGDVDYITKLWDILPSTARYGEYLDIVKRASVMRRLIDICGEVTKKAYTDQSTSEVIAYAEERLFELSQKGTNNGLMDLRSVASKTLSDINARYNDPTIFKGIPTGFRMLDTLTNGMHGGELIVIAARPGIGKSALAMNIAENVSKTGRVVAVFSLEMGNQQLLERMMASMAHVELSGIKSGMLKGGQNDLVKLRNAYDMIVTKMHLYGNDSANIRPAEIRSQCRRLKQQHGLDLVIIDYIGLMRGDVEENGRSESRQNEVASITRGLKIMAKELDVPVIALSQLKRDAEIRNIGNKGDKTSIEPELSDLRESGAIEQDADIVMFIHREKQEGQEDKYKLLVKKHRNGSTADIDLLWIGSHVRFLDKSEESTISTKVETPIVEDETVLLSDSVSGDGWIDNSTEDK